MTAKEWLNAYKTKGCTLDTILEEAEKLIKGIDETETQIELLHVDNGRLCERLAKMEIDINKSNDEFFKIAKNVEFLKGQVEAYQHCINCISCIRK